MMRLSIERENAATEHGKEGRQLCTVGRQPGAMGRRPGAMGRRPGAMGRRPGDMGRRQGATGRQPGATGRQPGAMGRRPGDMGRRPGAMGRRPGGLGSNRVRWVGECGTTHTLLRQSWVLRKRTPLGGASSVSRRLLALWYGCNLIHRGECNQFQLLIQI